VIDRTPCPAVSPYRAQFTTSCAAAPTVDDKNPAMIDVAVVGPGPIGCAFGGAGILAGRRVVFAARTPFDRLTVNYPDVTVDEAADVITNPVEATEASIVLVATKTYQTEEAAGWFERLVGPETLVVVLQNGVTHMDRVPPLLGGRGQVLPAVVACPAERTSPGRVTVTGKVMLRIPEGPTGRRLVEAFEGSMADIRLERDWLTQAWIKLILNHASGAVGVLVRRDNSIHQLPESAQLLRGLMAEAVEVGKAEGAKLPDDIIDRIYQGLMAGAGSHLASIVADRLAGQPTEWRERNEVIVRLAAVHGIDVPLSAVTTTLMSLGEPGTPGERKAIAP
jgi:2-dehydropantoate 2-reductase